MLYTIDYAIKEKLLWLEKARTNMIENATEFSKPQALTKVQTTRLTHFAYV